ncbi:hypothetical protein QFZ79_001729 [Arthrobacter sp. V4I6]|nr:hypothetical protein [Arthrobacter sp. V1I7]MDQ0853618.1 hypothetical protein [Arthrobacter sp. V4I6]
MIDTGRPVAPVAGMQAGDFITDAVAPINTSRRTGCRVLVEAGGVRPRRGRGLKGRCLTFGQREEIAVLCAQRRSLRAIGTVIGQGLHGVAEESFGEALPAVIGVGE